MFGFIVLLEDPRPSMKTLLSHTASNIVFQNIHYANVQGSQCQRPENITESPCLTVGKVFSLKASFSFKLIFYNIMYSGNRNIPVSGDAPVALRLPMIGYSLVSDLFLVFLIIF